MANTQTNNAAPPVELPALQPAKSNAPSAAGHRPFVRSNTTYGSMTQWMGQKRGVAPRTLPFPVTESKWPRRSCVEFGQERPGKTASVQDYQQRYNQLMHNVAFRYPNPGVPRERQGRIGGSWRHIREVLSNGGNRVIFVEGEPLWPGLYDASLAERRGRKGGRWSHVNNVQLGTGSRCLFIDNNAAMLKAAQGLVSLYDTSGKEAPGSAKRWKHKQLQATPLYALNPTDIDTYRTALKADMEKRAYRPWGSPSREQRNAPNEQLPDIPPSSTKHKGFYTLKQ